MKNLVKIVLIALSSIIMVNCSKDKGTDTPQTTEIKISETSPVEIVLNETKTITLSGGDSKNYSVKAEKADLVQINVTSNALTIKGISIGETTLKVTSADKISEFKVKITASEIKTSLPSTSVNLSTTETTEITLSGGDSKTYQVEIDDTNIATAEVTGNKVVITPINQGNTTLRIKSADKTIEIKLAVSTPEITLPSTSVTLIAENSKEITLGGGNGKNYTAISSEKDVVGVSVSGNILKIEALSKGQATITITSAGRSVEISVKVFPLLKKEGFYNLDGTVLLENKYKAATGTYIHISDYTGGSPSNKYIRLFFVDATSVVGNEYDYEIRTKGLDLATGKYKSVLERLSDGTAQLRYENYFFVTRVKN